MHTLARQSCRGCAQVGGVPADLQASVKMLGGLLWSYAKGGNFCELLQMYWGCATCVKHILVSEVFVSMQGKLNGVEGISLTGLRVDSAMVAALSCMPDLRILILDGIKFDGVLSGAHLPQLAMLSWRDAGGPLLPFSFKAVKSAAVLDISDNNELERIPADLQACLFS